MSAVSARAGSTSSPCNSISRFPGPVRKPLRYPSYALNPFLITERRATDFRFEAFNAFNRANFNNPNATIGTSSAGVISGTGPARILQASLKVIF